MHKKSLSVNQEAIKMENRIQIANAIKGLFQKQHEMARQKVPVP